MAWPTAAGRFDLGDVALGSGEVLPGAFITWRSHGTLEPDRSNAVVFPTSYSAQAADQDWLIAPDGILDPTRWFVVVPDMFGNGASSSPSNTPGYPALVTTADNVRAQRRLLAEACGGAPRTSTPRRRPGCTRTSPPTRSTAATSWRRSPPSGRGCC